MDIITLILHGIKTARRDWQRSIWLFAGVMLGLSFYLTISTLGAGYNALVRLPFSRLKSDLMIQVGSSGQDRNSAETSAVRLPFSNQAISRQQIQAIAALPGVRRLDPAILLWYREKGRFFTLLGIDPDRTATGPARILQWVHRGRSLQTRRELVLESHFARFNGLKPGDTILLKGQPFTVTGIATIEEGASLAAANCYLDIEAARELAAMAPGSANLLSIGLARGVTPEAVQDKIMALLPRAIVSSTESIGHMMRGFAGISAMATHLLALITLVFIVLLIWWLIAGRIQEQRQQLGLMRVLGWRQREMVVSVGAEALAITLAGGLAGIVLGLVAVRIIGSFEVSLVLPWNLAPTPGGMGQGTVGRTLSVPLPIPLQWGKILTVLAAACLTAILSALVTVIRIARQNIRMSLLA